MRRRMKCCCWAAVRAAVVVALVVSLTAMEERQVPEGEGDLVTVGRTAEAGAAGLPALSSDGRFAVFASDGGVWRRHLGTGAEDRVDAPFGGGSPAGGAGHPVVSADGCVVAFESTASDLVASDTNGLGDVFVRDLCADPATTTRVSVDPNGGQVTDRASGDPTISADGTTVAFVSRSAQIDPTREDASVSDTVDVFVRVLDDDASMLVSRRPSLVAVGTTHASGAHFSEVRLAAQALDGDGSTLVFGASHGGDPTDVAPCTGDETYWAPYVVDVASGVARQVFASDVGCRADPVISTDGVALALTSAGGDGIVVSRPTGGTGLRTLDLGAAADGVSGPLAIAADASRIAFLSDEPLVDGDTNDETDAFTVDLDDGVVRRVAPSAGPQPDGPTDAVALSAGRTAVVRTTATNLDAGDTSADADIYAFGLADPPLRQEPREHHTLSHSDAGTGPSQVISEGIVDGLRVQVDGATGVRTGDIQITPSYSAMEPVAEVLAGPVFDIEVPEGATFTSATITLPYVQSSVGTWDEESLSIWTYDDELRAWVPAPGDQYVDTTADTVTVEVAHLSQYGVFKAASGYGEWTSVIGEQPEEYCPPEAVGEGLNIVIAVERSYAMALSDEDEMRWHLPQAVADQLGSGYYGAARFFDSQVHQGSGLTANPSMNFIGATGYRSNAGEPNVAVGLEDAIDILGTGDPDRRGVVLLVSGGGSGFLHEEQLMAAAEEAAGEDIVVHTFTTEDYANPYMTAASAITGGAARSGSQVEDVPDLADELAEIIADTGLDGDGDGLTDCEEENGMFTLIGDHEDGDPGYLIRTLPDDEDSDDDGLEDGEEMERRDLVVDGLFSAYALDTMETTYFAMRAHPRQRDTDGDTLSDGLELTVCALNEECAGWSYWHGASDPLFRDTDDDGAYDDLEFVNGTDPNDYDWWWDYGNGFSSIAPFTLFQPDELGSDPVFEAAWQKIDQSSGETGYQWAYFNPEVITYDDDGLCATNCSPIDAYLQMAGTSNGSGVCIAGWFGTCLTLEDQERRVIEDARLWQATFDEDGYLSAEFMSAQAGRACAAYIDGGCDAEEIADQVDGLDLSQIDLTDPNAALTVATATATLVSTTANTPPASLKQSVVDNIAAATVAAEATNPENDEIATAALVRTCEQSAAALTAGFMYGAHPCDLYPIFFPGADYPEATEHIDDAIDLNPARSVLNYKPRAEVRDSGLAVRWYNSQPECNTAARAAAEAQRPNVELDCDEYPFYSSAQSGPGASLRIISAADNRGLGNRYGAFANSPACKPRVKEARLPFLVVPVEPSLGVPTGWIC